MNTNKHNNSVSVAHPIKDFRGKFKEWKNMLLGKDQHSIRNQVYDMIFDCAIFQCINESRKYAAIDDKGEIKQNKIMRYFINQSFFKTQLLSIRRLVDKDFNRVRRNKQYTVYSLYNLIEDMKKNDSLLTRKNILAFHNLPYDYERALADFKRNTGYTKGIFVVPKEIASSEDIHRRIDSMAGISDGKRSPEDLVPDNILKRFDNKLKSIEELCKYVNKFIAHAAIPESRKVIKDDEIKEALGKVLNAQRIICETASFIGNNLLFCGFGEFLPPPRLEQFEYLDEPISSEETIEKLRETWKKYWLKTQRWNI